MLINDILNSKFLNVINVNYTDNNSKLNVITGENATGKSLLRKIITGKARKNNVFAYHFSQQARSTGGFERAFIYGSEDDESTGQISAHVTLKSFSNSLKNTNQHIIVWDEPDTGLSDAYAAGLGSKIHDFLLTNHEPLLATFLISHNKHLIKQLMPLNPNHFAVGNKHSLQDWLNEPVTPIDPSELQGKAIELYRKLNKLGI